jgi:hypothetical protein
VDRYRAPKVVALRGKSTGPPFPKDRPASDFWGIHAWETSARSSAKCLGF